MAVLPSSKRDINASRRVLRPLLLVVVLVGLFVSSGFHTSRLHAQTRRWVKADVDGDGRSDLVVWRPTDGVWYVLESSTDYTTTTIVPLGDRAQGDVPVTGELDGDGKRDFLVWRPSINPGGTYIWRLSSTYYASGGSAPAGVAAWGAVPLIGDLDGDGRGDLFTFSQSGASAFNWSGRSSSTDYVGLIILGRFGAPGYQPMFADFDGDGKDDQVLFRASTGDWVWAFSSKFYFNGDGRLFGGPGDQPFIGDFDGDGRPDIAVWRPSTGEWFWLTSTSGWSTGLTRTFGSGSVGDVPQLGDFDGDGRSDLAIWRPGTGEWFWLTSSSGWSTGRSITFGTGTLGDIPMVK